MVVRRGKQYSELYRETPDFSQWMSEEDSEDSMYREGDGSLGKIGTDTSEWGMSLMKMFETDRSHTP